MATVSQRPVAAATSNPRTGRTVPTTMAVPTGTIPAAIGRNRFVGWMRSSFTSRASFQK